jgi:hypothetical protein
MDLAPIAFIVYNRPKHTLEVLEALMQNKFADQSSLYIFADGPKKGASKEQLDSIAATRKVLREKQWCKHVEIFERDTNAGLAVAIVDAITQVIKLKDKVIVLEDDILPSKYFLSYMNDGLKLFENRKDIGSVNAFSSDFLAKNKFPLYFLINNSDCWGWATWKNRWDDFIFDAAFLKEELIKHDKLNLFEYGGHLEILESTIKGEISTWDIQWHAINILKNRKGLFAKIPFIDNIGRDGSGVHYNTKPEEEIKRVKLNDYKVSLTDFVSSEPLIYSDKVEQKFRKHYLRYFKTPFRKKIKNLAKRVVGKIARLATRLNIFVNAF